MTVLADAGDVDTFKFHLPRTRLPEPLMEGIRGWKTKDGYLVLRIHYTCDPERATEDWIEQTKKGYRGGTEGSDWQREMEIDFGSYAGQPVYPSFNSTKSVIPVKYNPHIPLWRGWDFGYRNPAVTFYQLWEDDTLVYLHEMFPTLDKEERPGISTADLAQLVVAETDRLFPGAQSPEDSAGVFDFCDPSGNNKKETSDFSSVEILQQAGITPDFSVVGRKNRIAYARPYVEGTHSDGKPKFLINPHCALGIEAFAAAYRYPDDSSGGADREMPDLGKKIQSEAFIHIMDSFEYVVACNLEITYQTKTGFIEEDTRNEVADLASIYLGAIDGQERYSGRTVKRVNDISDSLDLEVGLQELLGQDSLADAMLDV